MPGFVVFLVIFIFFVLIANAVVLILRSRKNQSPYGRRGKIAPTENISAAFRDKEVERRINLEQEHIKKYLEHRDYTWGLYEEVRKRHRNEE